MKDRFSSNSADYAHFRPNYPIGLFQWLASLTDNQNCWDVGTGNGQAAIQLATIFTSVEATDISEEQLKQAIPYPAIRYSKQAAESTTFPNHHFNLIVVAQAVHWFQFDSFYQEVRRTSAKNGILALIGYNRPTISPTIDDLITHFYHDIIGSYWDVERRHIDANYQTIPFPFKQVYPPANLQLTTPFKWTAEHLLGYLGTWSAVKKYTQATGQDPVRVIAEDLRKAFITETMPVHFPLLLKIGQIHG